MLGLLETRAVNLILLLFVILMNHLFKDFCKDKFLSTKLKQLSNLPTQFDRESLQKYYYKD